MRKLLPYFMLGLALLFIIYDYVVQVAPSIMMSLIMTDFQITSKGFGILGACFLLAYAVMQIPAGMLLNRFGVRLMLTIAALVSGLGALLFAFSHGLLAGSSARMLIGAGSAFSFLGGVYIAYRWLKPRHFAFAVGCLQLGAGSGAILGEAPLAKMLHTISWRHSFLLIAGCAFLLALIFAIFIRNSPTPAKKIARNHYGIMSVLKHRQLWSLATINFITWLPASAVGGLWGIPYLHQAKHLTNTEAGAVFIALWATLSLMAPVIGAVADKLANRKLVMLICLGVAVIGSIGLLWAPELSGTQIKGLLILLGIAPASQCIVFSLLRQKVTMHQYSMSAAVCNMASVIGGAFGQVSMGYLIAWHAVRTSSGSIPVYSTSNYQLGMLLVPVMLLIGLVVTAVFVKNENR